MLLIWEGVCLRFWMPSTASASSKRKREPASSNVSQNLVVLRSNLLAPLIGDRQVTSIMAAPAPMHDNTAGRPQRRRRLTLLLEALVRSAIVRPFFQPPQGGVAEWSKAHAWKVCRRVTVSRVRIPPPPPLLR